MANIGSPLQTMKLWDNFLRDCMETAMHETFERELEKGWGMDCREQPFTGFSSRVH